MFPFWSKKVQKQMAVRFRSQFFQEGEKNYGTQSRDVQVFGDREGDERQGTGPSLDPGGRQSGPRVDTITTPLPQRLSLATTQGRPA